jgi:hypothetical protein
MRKESRRRAGRAAKERTIAISGDSIKMPQMKPKKNKPILYHKTLHDPKKITGSQSASVYSSPSPFSNRYILMLPMKTPGRMSSHIQDEMTHCNEMNNKIFNIDIDMNMRDITINVMESISFHLFHGQSSSTTFI